MYPGQNLRNQGMQVMQVIDIVAIVAAVIAALTKIIDVVTTIKYVGVEHEMNPMGRKLFRRYGVVKGCWITFAIEAVLIAAVTWAVLAFGDMVEKVALLVVCALLTWGNISAGILNKYHRATLIVRLVSKHYMWLNRKLR